jgi:uncharacterized protein YuzE
MANLHVTYDREADAAYIYFIEPHTESQVARTYVCNTQEVDGMINLDFNESGRVVGIEVLAASSKLPQYLLDAAERLDT